MAGGEKMFVVPPKAFQLGDKELEVGKGKGSCSIALLTPQEWLRSVERPQIRRPISFLEVS